MMKPSSWSCEQAPLSRNNRDRTSASEAARREKLGPRCSCGRLPWGCGHLHLSVQIKHFRITAAGIQYLAIISASILHPADPVVLLRLPTPNLVLLFRAEDCPGCPTSIHLPLKLQTVTIRSLAVCILDTTLLEDVLHWYYLGTDTSIRCLS